ncbi:hypothetical protein KC573_02330, partial [candidate division WWE3 bacterium]|nr:hypothetical protein [candidate division WWE3 bacterium]
MVSDTKTSHHQEPTQREIHYTWGKFKAVIGIILTVSALFFFLGLFADNAKAGDSLYGIDLWLEEVKFSTTFRHSAKQDVAIGIATERLTELLELETNDKETKLLALYELDKALVRVINLTNPSDTDVIASLQEERQKTARLIAIIQGVYAQNEPQNIQNNDHSEVENEQVTAEHDDFIEFGTS